MENRSLICTSCARMWSAASESVGMIASSTRPPFHQATSRSGPQGRAQGQCRSSCRRRRNARPALRPQGPSADVHILQARVPAHRRQRLHQTVRIREACNAVEHAVFDAELPLSSFAAGSMLIPRPIVNVASAMAVNSSTVVPPAARGEKFCLLPSRADRSGRMIALSPKDSTISLSSLTSAG